MVTAREQKLQKLIEMEKLLGEIQDVDVLLERLLSEARKIVNADAGSIYVYENEKIKIKYAQNDTRLKELQPGEKLPYISFSFPLDEKSICGYVALKGKILNLTDVYRISPELPYKFDNTTDITTNYHTQSMLTIPLMTANGRLLGVLQIINATDKNNKVISFDNDSILYIKHFATNATQALEHAYLTSSMVKRMLKMSEFRDPKETYPHVERVSNYSREIYDRWAFNNDINDLERNKFRDILTIASKCHDVGKVGISDLILKKRAPRFSEIERNIMKSHTCIGAQLFDPIDSDLDLMSRDVALHHHEWFNGDLKGYPGKIDYKCYEIGTPLNCGESLKCDEIPLAARIVAVADVFDALSHKRCYKNAWSLDEAFFEIEKMSGKQFDPEVVKAFLQVKDRICAINFDCPDDNI